jgi:hypothetical protein
MRRGFIKNFDLVNLLEVHPMGALQFDQNGKILLRGEVFKPGCQFVSRVKNEYVASWLLVNLFPLHLN